MMAVSYFGLLLVLVLGLLVLGGIAAVVALLASPKTRAAGAGVVAIGRLVVLLGA